MAIITCQNCGTKNRVDESAAQMGQPVCGKCGAHLAAGGSTAHDGEPQIISDDSFSRDVIEASSIAPVLVDLWAEWCGPCRMIAPVLDQLAAESRGRYKITKLNIDENPQVPGQYGIRSIPTMLIFKNGRLVDQIVGAMPKQLIAARLAKQF